MEMKWWRGLVGRGNRPAAGFGPRRFRPRLENLEDRCVPAGLAVTDLTGGLTPTALVQELVGAGVVVSNITYKGTNMSSGEFTGGTGIIGFESGIILSTGHSKAVVGPNDNSDSASFDNGLPGDPQLDTLIPPPGNSSHDATVLSFDFVPQGSTLSFNYVFGSEEYGQFVGAGFNDVFGFFLNGQNVALLPGTNTPVGVGTVNDGNPSNGTAPQNPQFFINNSPPGDPVPAPNAVNTQLDGLTVVLPVTVQVNPGVVNHISLGVEDVQDAQLDSDVFIQAGSFAAPLAPVLKAYRPFRYAFRTLEQNEGQSGPVPLSGTASVPTLDGVITVLNVGTADATGPLTFEFTNLPQGVTVVNATGVDPATNNPIITVPVADLPKGGTTPLRFLVKLSDPLDLPLDTFFVGGYELEGM